MSLSMSLFVYFRGVKVLHCKFGHLFNTGTTAQELIKAIAPIYQKYYDGWKVYAFKDENRSTIPKGSNIIDYMAANGYSDGSVLLSEV